MKRQSFNLVALIVAICAAQLLGSIRMALGAGPEFSADLHISVRSVILESWTRGFGVSFAWWTPLSEAEFASHFPESYNGGTRGTCGIRSLGGLQIDLADSITWREVYIQDGGTVWSIEPLEVYLDVVAHDPTRPDPRSDFINLKSEPPFYPNRFFDGNYFWSAYLELEVSPFNGPEIPWSAEVTFECFCHYRVADTNEYVGSLASEDIGQTPITLREADVDIPRYGVATRSGSWGALKSRY